MGKEMMKRNKGWTIVFYTLFIILIISSLYMLYSIALLNNIENKLRLIGAIVIILISILLIFLSVRSIIKHRKKSRIVLTIIMILYSTILFFAAFNIHKVIGKLGNVSTTVTTYSASLVTLKDNKAETISDIGSADIGMLKDVNSVDGYQIPKQVMKKQKLSNKVIEYEDYISMIHDLYEGEIDYIFLPSEYVVRFRSFEGLENIEYETKILHSEDKDVKNTSLKRGNKIDKPITILLMGVDSEKENIKGASFNGDSLMLLTFNPTTLNTTILSIPRDTYVPIACFSGNRKNKITHAAMYGESCMIDTIENFTGITIDYYVKINFKGVVKLVDALGGIEVDVPIEFCEQDSNRDFSNLICLNKGLQTLNGEEALALSRHRKTVNDFVRGQNQQLVVKGLMNKAKSIRDIDTIYKLLDTISDNMETNMSTNEILSFYDVAKDILEKSKETTSVDELLGMQRLYISGFDAMIYDYSTVGNGGTRMTLYNFVPYNGSMKDVTKAMKVNLGLENPEVIKTFSFDVDEPYTEIVIGRGNYNDATLNLLPNFVGYDKSKAINYGNQHGIKVTVNYVTSAQNKDQIITQSLHSGMDITEISKSTGLTITVSDGKGTNNDDDEEDVLPNFVGKLYNGTTLSNFNEQHKTVRIVLVEVKEGEKGYDSTKRGQIISQDVKAGTDISELVGKTVTLKYIAPGKDNEEEDDENSGSLGGDNNNNQTGENDNDDGEDSEEKEEDENELPDELNP